MLLILIEILFYQIPGSETVILEIIKIIVPSAVSGYIGYLVGKPKVKADIDKTYSDTITGLYAKLDDWIVKYEASKKDHLKTLDDLGAARRELADCKDDANAPCRNCLDALDAILIRIENKLSTDPEGANLLLELKKIRVSYLPPPVA